MPHLAKPHEILDETIATTIGGPRLKMKIQGIQTRYEQIFGERPRVICIRTVHQFVTFL
jgi:hypothetical protein